MRRKLPPLNALLAFEAAARHGNFTRAASELGVAQPAVTRHITNLEEWLGCKLFIRTGNSVIVSQEGYAVSELVTSAIDRLEIGLGQFSTSRKNEIVIGASFGMMHLWLMPQITAMRDAAKGAAINFMSSENYSDYEDSKIDFSIRFGSGNWVGKRADLIFSETTHVIASPKFIESHPDIDPNNLPHTLLPEWMLEHGDPHNYGWMTWQLWYEHHGLILPDAAGFPDVGNYPTLLDMVRCGEGIALGYVGLDDHLVETGDIIRLGPAMRRQDVGYYLLSNADADNKEAHEELRNYLVQD